MTWTQTEDDEFPSTRRHAQRLLYFRNMAKNQESYSSRINVAGLKPSRYYPCIALDSHSLLLSTTSQFLSSQTSCTSHGILMAGPAKLVSCSIAMLLVSALAGMSVAQLDMSDLDFIPEPKKREEFPASDFIFKFQKVDVQTKFGNLRNLFVGQDPALADLPGDGVGQNLVTVGPCAINQPHSHPRGTEISHVTEGMSPFISSSCLSSQENCDLLKVKLVFSFQSCNCVQSEGQRQ